MLCQQESLAQMYWLGVRKVTELNKTEQKKKIETEKK